MVIHQTARAQIRRDAEEKVESSYQPTVPTKLRDQPSRLGRCGVSQARDQRFQIRLIEAIEEEVRDNEVVLSSWQRRNTRVFAAVIDVFPAGTFASQHQHPRAYVNVIDARLWSGRQQRRERPAVAVAQRQNAPRIGHIT